MLDVYYTHLAKIWHKESMTIGKASAFKTYYDARNPLVVHLKYRTPLEVKPYMQRLLKSNFKSSLRFVFYFRFNYFFSMWKGYFSALIWAKKNKKLTIKHFI